MNNNAKVKKWLKENYKSDRLIFNADTNLISNGYVIKKVDSFMLEEIEKIHGSVNSFYIMKGKDYGNAINLQKVIDSMDDKKFPCMDTKFTYNNSDMELKIFHTQNKDGEDDLTYVNKDLFDIFDINNSSLGIEYEKSAIKNSAVFILVDGEIDGLIMPINMLGKQNGYKLVVR